MLRKIQFYGGLADKFTDEPFEMDVDDSFGLTCALRSRFSEFRTYIREYPGQFIILSDDDKTNPNGIEMDNQPYGNAKEIHIVPNQAGSGIEIAVAVFGMAAGTAAAIAVNVVANILLSMAIGAIAQSLAPKPKTTAMDRPEESPSFLYNGPENVQEQGWPVPVIYGAHMTGSVVISAGVSIEQIPYVPTKATPPANGGGGSQPSDPPAADYQWESTGGA